MAAAHTEQLVAEWGPDAPEDSLAKEIARGLLGSVPVIAGAGLTTPIAYRWKTQINENAKQPCLHARAARARPQRARGLGGRPRRGPLLGGVPRRLDTHPRVKARIELTRRLIADRCRRRHYRVETRRARPRSSASSRSVLLGDLSRCTSRVLRGVDPGPVELIEQLKAELAGPLAGTLQTLTRS